MSFAVERARAEHLEGWARLRAMLWPDDDVAAHRAEVEASPASELVGFVAVAGGEVIGFAEASVRRDYVNGCDTSPVAFLEGIAVDPAWRRRGVSRALLGAVEDWARGCGFSELGSDTELGNALGEAFHRGAGFEERERVVHYAKLL